MPKKTPSQLELEILKVLWHAEVLKELPLGVREVRLRLAATGRDLTHSSVITTLNIMVRKRFLKRTKVKNAYRFAPAIRQQHVCQQEVSNLLNRVFDGSAKHLMSALLDTKQIDAEQIAEIKRLINRKVKEE
jgi:BlaI family transcriptional regulator, penicillinase repressor